MELVDGPTLAERIARGPIPVADALPIAQQLAQALEYAHERGIIHRDLKPANIKITPDGDVKVLDFGLAKAMAPDLATAAGDLEAANSPTITTPAMTQAGIILGTAAYMSPEQARGAPVDKRTDIWAFGCVMYEMLTGRRAFEAASVTDTIAAVVLRDPDWSALPPGVPGAVSRLLRRSLQKEPRERLRDIGDARFDLMHNPERDGDGPARLAPRRPAPGGLRWAAAAAVLVAILSTGLFLVYGWARFERPGSTGPGHFTIRLPDSAPLAVGKGHPTGFDHPMIAISPDGRRLAYVAALGQQFMLYQLQIGQRGDPTPVEGTEGAYLPFFSPTSQDIGFFANGRLKTVSVQGGQAADLCDARSPWDGAWGDDGIYFVDDSGTAIKKIPAFRGGPPVDITPRSGTRRYRSVQILPGGKGLLVSVHDSSPMSFDYQDIMVWSAESAKWQMVLEGRGYRPYYTQSGHILYVTTGGLSGVGFDLDTLTVTGEPFLVLDGVKSDAIFGQAQIAVSSGSGRLVYVPGRDMALGVPAWVTPRANGTADVRRLEVPPGIYGVLDVSPDDGRRLAVHVGGSRDDIWIYVLSGPGNGSFEQLTFEGNNGWPVWIDGETVAFASEREGGWGLYRKRVGEASLPTSLYRSSLEHELWPYGWSSARSTLWFGESSAGGLLLGRLPLDGQPSSPTLDLVPYHDWGHKVSPDGRWVTYTSNLRRQSYVTDLEDLSRAIAIPHGGMVVEPVWSWSGDELYFRDGNRWMASAVVRNPSFSLGEPRQLFRVDFVDTNNLSYAVAPDGRFILVVPAFEDSDPTRIEIELDWLSDLNQRGPVRR